MLAIKYLMVPIDFHSTSFPTMEVNGNQQPFDYLKLFKMYIFFMFNMRMKLIQVYIGYRFTYKGKWYNFQFWVNYFSHTSKQPLVVVYQIKMFHNVWQSDFFDYFE